MRIEVIAGGAVSGLGAGRSRLASFRAGDAAVTAVRVDDELAAAGLARPRCARAPIEPGGGDRAARVLARALEEVIDELDHAAPRWRELRVGVALGTSSGGLRSFVEILEAVAAGRPPSPEALLAAPYFGPLDEVERKLGVRPETLVLVLGACASSALALGLARCWVRAGHVDIALAGGFDSVGSFVAGGFEALGVVTASLPAPFRAERDGLALGEGAAVLALARAGVSRSPALGELSGFGASADAGHPTAPDPSGAGLARAAAGALEEARLDVGALRVVSAHGTGTRLNDASELAALAALGVFDESEAVVHAAKGALGHALGAAGALESLAALEAGRRGLLPPSAGAGEPEAPVRGRLLERATPAPRGPALKLAAAFGGANAALVFDGPAPSAPLRERPVGLVARGAGVDDPSEVRRAHGQLDPARAARLDVPAALAVAAAARLVEGHPIPPSGRTGVVVGSSTSTLELDARFAARYLGRGARFADPRRFPATSPNLAPGLCAAAFGWRGPSLAVGAGARAAAEALLVAVDLVAGGVADAIVVIALEEWGEVVARLWAARGWPAAPTGAAAALVAATGAPALHREPLATALRDRGPWSGAGVAGGASGALGQALRIAQLAGGAGFS